MDFFPEKYDQLNSTLEEKCSCFDSHDVPCRVNLLFYFSDKFEYIIGLMMHW